MVWCGLGLTAVFGRESLDLVWPNWPWAFGAVAVWVGIAVVLVRGYGPPFLVSRPPFLVAAFALVVSILGTGNHWATSQLFPTSRVDIEFAAWFFAVCSATALMAGLVVRPFLRPVRAAPALEWVWPRLEIAMLVTVALAAIGTVMTLRRIGYIPILTGDPAAARVLFPVLGGVWYRLSMLGVVSALLAGALVAARQASARTYVAGLVSLLLVSVYGPRFFTALPLGVAVLLWDRLRARLTMTRLLIWSTVAIPALALLGYLREGDPSSSLIGPVGLILYGSFSEFRDLAWVLEYYGFGDRFLHGQTFGSAIVPLLPQEVWAVGGIDKMQIYAQSSAAALADVMGRSQGQRIGLFGECFINYGWLGALAGAAVLGTVVGYLDTRWLPAGAAQVRTLWLGLLGALFAFALIGQLDMLTSTLTGVGYPLALAVLFAARRSPVGMRPA